MLVLIPPVAAQIAAAVFTASTVLTADSRDGGVENLSTKPFLKQLSTSRSTAPSVRKHSLDGMNGTVMRSLSIFQKHFGSASPNWRNRKSSIETFASIAAIPCPKGT